MKHITKLMINEFKIKKLGYDFMGYSLQKGDMYNYHHLIIPARLGGERTRENGAILCGNTSHSYLHLIEYIDPDIFNYITTEMIDENIKGYLDVENIKRIHSILYQFEREHGSDRSNKGKLLIRERYYQRQNFNN